MLYVLYVSQLALSLHKKNMETIGDWIYIVVILIAGAASVLNSSRKKARQVAEQNQQPREVIIDPNDEDDFWGELTSQPEKKPVIKVQPRVQAKPTYSSIKNYHSPFLDINQEGESALQASEMIPTEIEDRAAIRIDDLPDGPDEWRKAFIYNEIFSRKN